MFLLNQEDFKKIARGIFYVFIATFPFLMYQGFIFNGTSTRAMNLILLTGIMAVFFGFLMFNKENRVSVARSPITISLFLLLVTLFTSSYLGVDFVASFWSKITRMSGLYYFIHLGLFYFFVMMLFKEEVSMRKFIKVFVVSTAINSLGSLLSKDGFGLIFANREWNAFTLGNSTFAAMYFFSAFILSIYFILSTEKASRKWWHYLLPVALALNPYFIEFTLLTGKVNLLQNPLGFIGSAQASTFALIASLILMIVAFVISKIKSVKLQKGLIWGVVTFGVVVMSFAFYSLLSSDGFIQKAYLEKATGARPIVWSLSKEAISERPVFGWGVDNLDRAYEAHYDNTVMEQANGGEAWFDRAHNIFIDQGVETGYVGLIIYMLVYLSIIGSMLYVIFKSNDKNDKTLATLIIIYFVCHLLELQTAFDTTISYIPVTIFAALGSLVFHKTYKNISGEKSECQVGEKTRYAMGVILIGVFGFLFFVGTVPILSTQLSNGKVRTAGSSEKRLPIYSSIFGSPVDTGGFLNRTYTDLQRGISLDPSILQKPERVEGFKKELELFASEYNKYLEKNPDDYRARIKLVDLYIYQRLFKVDNLALAQENADIAISVMPQGPQAYWQKSVAYLYARKFDLAKEWAQKAYDLNPNIEESVRLKDYIDRSIKTFPVIDLYNFKQI